MVARCLASRRTRLPKSCALRHVNEWDLRGLATNMICSFGVRQPEESGCGTFFRRDRGVHRSGTSRFNSSVQFKTICICEAEAGVFVLMPVSISPTTFPLRPMSYSRLPTPARAEDASEVRCARTGSPVANAGLVVTLTERNWPGPGDENSDEPSGDQTGWLPAPISYSVPVAGNGCTYVRVPVACALTV